MPRKSARVDYYKTTWLLMLQSRAEGRPDDFSIPLRRTVPSFDNSRMYPPGVRMSVKRILIAEVLLLRLPPNEIPSQKDALQFQDFEDYEFRSIGQRFHETIERSHYSHHFHERRRFLLFVTSGLATEKNNLHPNLTLVTAVPAKRLPPANSEYTHNAVEMEPTSKSSRLGFLTNSFARTYRPGDSLSSRKTCQSL